MKQEEIFALLEQAPIESKTRYLQLVKEGYHAAFYGKEALFMEKHFPDFNNYPVRIDGERIDLK